jgi:uncharacterized protein (DUF1800 family)
MSPSALSLTPEEAWLPLAPGAWNQESARHLLRRMGFSASPDAVQRATRQGLAATLAENLGQIRPMATPASLAEYYQRSAGEFAATQAAERAGNLELRRTLGSDSIRDTWISYEKGMDALLEFARQPENSAQENLVMFLCGVLVTARNKINDLNWLFTYFARIRTLWKMPYPDICRRLPHFAAMDDYLDLTESRRGVPDENYARELLELFTLGQGHYTEHDVKEVSRALTGFTIQDDEVVFVPSRWDPGQKTIFGRTGAWGADDVVNLIFTQPTARTYLPSRFLSWYLSDDPLPDTCLEPLGHQWVQRGWRVDALAEIVFSSRLFYEPQFRGNLIKSPLRFYLGMCQDLGVDVAPLVDDTRDWLHATGQDPLNPPNVRGWVGGRTWLNSSTWAARRRLIEQVARPYDESSLYPEAVIQLALARAAGKGQFSVDASFATTLAQQTDDELLQSLSERFLAGAMDPSYQNLLRDYLRQASGSRPELVGDMVVALLQSPAYQVC